jgi:hypothetical protein
LENDLQSPSPERFADQLAAVTESLVASNLKVRKEALDSLVEGDSMRGKLGARNRTRSSLA